MTTTHKPATPLPWGMYRDSDARIGTLIVGGDQMPGASRQPSVARITGRGNSQDATYIAHACNAYPQLVEALRCVAIGKPHAKRAADLLRELGEAE